MNVQELEKKLRELGVRENSYVLNGSAQNETYALERDGKEWIVVYSERGERDVLGRFSTESEACEHLLEVLLEDYATRPRAQ